MDVVAKFVCESIKDNAVKLRAVYDPNPDSENGAFFKYTPWGEINMGIINDAALEEFEVGAEYLVNFKKA